MLTSNSSDAEGPLDQIQHRTVRRHLHDREHLQATRQPPSRRSVGSLGRELYVAESGMWQRLIQLPDRALRVPVEDREAAGIPPNHVQINPRYGGGFPANVEGLHHLHCLVGSPRRVRRTTAHESSESSPPGSILQLPLLQEIGQRCLCEQGIYPSPPCL